MDQLYFEDGYYEGKYFVYTADVLVGFTPYIDVGYLNSDFFEDRGGAFTLVGDITRQAFQQGLAALSANFAVNGTVGRLQLAASALTAQFTTSATVRKTARADSALASSITVATVSRKTARSSVTLSTIANVAAQADDRTRSILSALTSLFTQSSSSQVSKTVSATLSSAVTQTSNTIITARATLGLTSAFAPVITAVASVSNGSNFSSNFSLTASTGVIRNAKISSPIGVDATSEPSSTASPFLKFGSSTTVTAIDGSGYATGVDTTGKFIFSAWMYNPIGYVFDTDPNAYIYTGSGVPPDWQNNSIQVETQGGVPYFYYYGRNGRVEFDLEFPDRFSGYHHYLLRVDTTKSTNAEKYRLFVDGVERTQKTVYQRGGLGAGLNFTAQTTAFNIDLTAFDQYQLMMNTSGGLLKLGSSGGPNGGGYGDSEGVKANRSALTQFVFDYGAANYPIEDLSYRQKFYNGGYVDLGLTGTSTGLTQPKHYVRLLDYQDTYERGTKSTVQNQWSWKSLVYDSNYSSIRQYYTVEPYTAGLDQNSLGILPGIRSAFALTADSVTVLETTSTISAVSTLSATVGYRVNIVKTITAQATLDASVNKFASTTAALNSTSTQTIIYQRVRYAASQQSSQFALTADSIRVQPATAALTATTTQTVTGFRIKPLTAALVSRFTVSAQIDDRTRDAIALNAGSFTLTAAVGRIRGFGSGITATCTFSTVYEVIRPAGSAMSATFTQTANPSKVIVSFGNFTARFTQQVNVFRVAIAQANLIVTGFQLTQGDILNFDPCREIAVDQETRLARILPENRLVIVESETRILKVPQETRVLRVDYETRVNTIKC